MAQDFGFTVVIGKQAHSRLRNCFSSAAVGTKDKSDSGIIEFSFLYQTMSAFIESELNQKLRGCGCSTKHAEILFLLMYRLKFVVMYRSLRKLSFILIALMVTAGCSSFQTVAKKKRDLSTSSY
ncbi:MAG: hypothetical protein GQ529_04195, partial [Methyloprofundus sp.]|nr:hypothetical protein [Methyloprofundus sp.]